jgi:hypothetical protein
MNATLTTNNESQEFTEWKELIDFLTKHPDKNQIHTLNIAVHAAQTFFQYRFDMNAQSILQILHVLKDIEYKVKKIWDKYTDALPGDGEEW